MKSILQYASSQIIMEFEMKRILLIHSSLFANESASGQLGEDLVSELMEQNPGSVVTTLDLATTPLPHLDAEEFGSWNVDVEQRSVAQQNRNVPV